MDSVSEEFVAILDNQKAKDQWNLFQQMTPAEQQMSYQMMILTIAQDKRAIRKLLAKQEQALAA